MESINIGPLALPLRPVLFLFACIAAYLVGQRIAQRQKTDIKSALLNILYVGLGTARLSFVLLYWETYASKPWTMLDIRDGGWAVTPGIAAALLMAALMGFRNRTWKRSLLVSLITFFTLWGGITLALDAGKKSISVPQMVLRDLHGSSVALDSFVGKPMVINLWASWCPPCRREMPVLRDAQQTHADVTILFANQGESVDAVRAYLESESLQLQNVLLDRAGSIAKHVGSFGLPITLFFDRAGVLVDARIGELSRATLEHRLKSLRTQ